MQILVADNNKTITKIIKMALDEEGYSVQVAHSPDEVLDLISKSQFDVFILDTKFNKENDGYELVQKIKREGIEGKFILLVSALEKPDNELAKKLGIYAFLTKPVDSRKLFQLISEIEEELKSEGKLKRKKQKIIRSEEITEVEEIGKKRESDYEGYSELIQSLQTENPEEEQKKEYNSSAEYTGSEDKTDKGIQEEKKDISFSWMEETALSMKDELLLLLNAVREVFSEIKRVKDEAENYIVEIRSSVGTLKKKIEDIPEMDKIVNKLLTDTLNYIEPKLGEKINLVIEKKLNLFGKSIQSDLISSIKKDIMDEIRDYIKNQQESMVKENSQNVDTALQNVKAEFLNEIKKLEDQIEKKVSGMVNEKIKEISGAIFQGAHSDKPLLQNLQEDEIVEDLTYETEDKTAELREEEEKYGEVFQLSEEDVQFLELEEVSEGQEAILPKSDETEKTEQKEEDFISIEEI